MSYITKQALHMKKIDGILISVTGYKYVPLSGNRMRDSMTQKQYNDFCLYMADFLCDEFKKAITKQRYESSISKGSLKWKPLTVKYLTWKKVHKLSLNIWEATGTLKNHIKVFKRKNYLVVGFQPYDQYPKTELRIEQVAKWMEFGTSKMPARPLFRPITIYNRKNVDRCYARYQKALKKESKEYLYIE